MNMAAGRTKGDKTLVLGASENTERYSNMAVRSLVAHGEPVVAIGNRAGEVEGVPILTGTPSIEGVSTVTLYLSSKNQQPLYGYILSLHPERVIFNPGTENPDFESMLKESGVEVIEACTLVMLSTGQYR